MSEARPLSVTWLGHSTVLIELDGARLLTDPLLRRRAGPLVRIAPRLPDGADHAVDVVLLSHLHGDHCDLPSLRRLPGPVPIVAPQGAAAWLGKRGLPLVHELRAGERMEVGGVTVTATTAVHEGRRAPLGPSAEAVGFLVEGSQCVYFAGDTDLFDGMARLGAHVDLALLPVWGWGPNLGPGHLDPERAAAAAALIAPSVAVPIHWGTFGLPRPLRRGPDRDWPPSEFVRHMRERAPDVDVRVLLPGQNTQLARHSAAVVPPDLA
ncbi:MAG TPA: MBL fold metallo-hydrolase [Thermoleophilaceae bacterium]